MTRRLISVFFLVLIVMNITGHSVLLKAVEHRLAERTQELLESHSAEIGGSLILVMPIGIHGIAESENYNKVGESIAFDGKSYKRVKETVHDNLRYIVCVTDNTTDIARDEANSLIMALSNQGSNGLDAAAVKLLSTILKSFIPGHEENSSAACGWSRQIDYSSFADYYCFTSVSSVFHPPAFQARLPLA